MVTSTFVGFEVATYGELAKPPPLEKVQLRRGFRFSEAPSLRLGGGDLYRQPLRLASLILRNLSLIDRVGSADASAFTVDMNVLFQDWVTDRLARHLRGSLRVVSEPTEHLGKRRKVPMYPDLELWSGDELLYVGDVRYKRTSSGLARNADYYQLLAYATALGLDEGVLIYCQDDGTVPEREIAVRHSETSLRTHALNLSGTPAEAEDAVRVLAERLMRWAVASRLAA